jgi:DNA-binding HxlR family transcriptional regulator
VDWQNLIRQLTPLRRQWDLAVLSNLTDSGDGTRPAELRKTINAQADDGRQISWKVLGARLRLLEASGYIARQEVTDRPRETRYWLLPPARQLVAALDLLETWLDQHDPGGHGRPPAEAAAARKRDGDAARRSR